MRHETFETHFFGFVSDRSEESEMTDPALDLGFVFTALDPDPLAHPFWDDDGPAEEKAAYRSSSWLVPIFIFALFVSSAVTVSLASCP